MSPACPEFRSLFAAYAAEALTSSERRAVREHLALCGPCREEASASDPTLLFAAGGPAEEVSAADMARILEGVRVGVAIKQAERRLAKPPRRAAVVAAAAAVALFTLALPGGPWAVPAHGFALALRGPDGFGRFGACGEGRNPRLCEGGFRRRRGRDGL